MNRPEQSCAAASAGAARTLTLTVNGERQVSSAATLTDLLVVLGYGDDQVATAHNGEFVARGKRGSTRLAEGDSIEIVSPRQGG